MEAGVVCTWVSVLTSRKYGRSRKRKSRNRRHSGSDEETKEGAHDWLWFRGGVRKVWMEGKSWKWRWGMLETNRVFIRERVNDEESIGKRSFREFRK